MSEKEKTGLLTKEHICSACGGNIIYDKEVGETVCVGCGLVITEEILNRGPEWRAFTKEEKDKKSRVGPGEILSRITKGSTFSEREKGLTIKQKQKFGRMKRHQRRAQESKDKALATAYAELDRLAGALNLPSYCIDEAAFVYRKAWDAGLVRGRSIDSMVAASLNVSVRMHKVPRTLKEVSSASSLPKKDVARFYRVLLKELKIKMPVPDARDYIAKIGGKADVSRSVQDLAYQILTEAHRRKISGGKDPRGLVAAALYVASEHSNEIKKTQGELAKAADVTEVTIRNRYKELEEAFESQYKMPIDELLEVYTS